MFRETEPGSASCLDSLSALSLPVKKPKCVWQLLELDPLSREKIEFHIARMIQLMLRSEGGDEAARVELKACI